MDASFAEYQGDLTELLFLARSAAKRLGEYHSLLKAKQAAYTDAAFEYLISRVAALADQLEAIVSEVSGELSRASTWTPIDYERLSVFKRRHTEVLRILYSDAGALLAAGNWQAPSFEATQHSEAGNRTGLVSVNCNDYVRDHYPAEEHYALMFGKEYVDTPMRLPPEVLLMSSCMAALTVALVEARSRAPQGPVFVGQSSYFQNKWTAHKICGDAVVEIDEFDTEGILARAAKERPSIVLLDAIAGTDSLAIPDLARLIPELAARMQPDGTIIVDTTAMATMLQPLEFLPLMSKVNLMVIASLSKYYQFGFDRVTAGALWAPVAVRRSISQTRQNLGTIIPEASLFAMPMPSRALLDARLRRIGRNARLLAERINASVQKNDSPIAHIVYPSLPSYRGYAWTKNMPFVGGTLTFAFKPEYDNAAQHEKFVKRVFSLAKQKGVALTGGAGFGYNTSRLYFLSKSAHAPHLKPFVRIAAGTETLQELERLADVFVEAVHLT